MRVIFMGTPDFAAVSLEKLIDDGFEIIAVFTKPDKPNGRGQKTAFCAVKTLALKHGIRIFQPPTLKDEEIQREIAALSPDVIAVAAYGRLLPQAVLETPKYGCVNLHGSLLPKYRGAAPIQRSVLNGDRVTGVTTMLMAQGMDTGDILEQCETPIGENETSSELFDRLAVIGAELFSHTLGELPKRTIIPKKQDDAAATTAPMLNKDMTAIDFSQNAETVHNTIRGLSDWPCAAAYLNGKRLKIYKSERVSGGARGAAGEITDVKEFIVACAENTAVKLLSVQYDGSKRMSGEEFLRGHKIPEHSVLVPTNEKM